MCIYIAECSGNFSDNSTELNVPECQPGHWITPLTMTAFMIVSCLLFLSILIASFKFVVIVLWNLLFVISFHFISLLF